MVDVTTARELNSFQYFRELFMVTSLDHFVSFIQKYIQIVNITLMVFTIMELHEFLRDYGFKSIQWVRKRFDHNFPFFAFAFVLS